MGKRSVFAVAAVLGCFLAVGCGEKKGGEAAAKDEAALAEAAAPPTWEGEYQCKSGDSECRDDKMYGEGIYFSGTVFNTVVNKDVNARSEPSSRGGNSTVIGQIRNETKVQVLGYTRDWVFVTTREAVPRRGWISASFVDYKEGQQMKVTEMKITDFNLTARDSSTADLTAVYKVGDAEMTMKFSAFKRSGQGFFVFFYDIYRENSHYTITPGLYVWRFARNQLSNATPMMRAPFVSGERVAVWEQAAFSDDLKFYFVNVPDGSPRVFRANAAPLFSETVVESFDTRAKTITGVCPADSEIAKYFSKTEEMNGAIDEYGEEYANNNPRGDNSQSLQVICETSLETGARKITGAEWR